MIWMEYTCFAMFTKCLTTTLKCLQVDFLHCLKGFILDGIASAGKQVEENSSGANGIVCLSLFGYIANLMIVSASIARKGGLLIEQVCESKVCKVKKNSQFTIIRFSQLNPVLQYISGSEDQQL